MLEILLGLDAGGRWWSLLDGGECCRGLLDANRHCCILLNADEHRWSQLDAGRTRWTRIHWKLLDPNFRGHRWIRTYCQFSLLSQIPQNANRWCWHQIHARECQWSLLKPAETSRLVEHPTNPSNFDNHPAGTSSIQGVHWYTVHPQFRSGSKSVQQAPIAFTNLNLQVWRGLAST